MTTYNSGNQYGVIFKGRKDKFIHDFNYGSNGSVNYGWAKYFIGINAGNFTMGSTANETFHANTVLGNNALTNNIGYQNVVFGYASLRFNDSGYQNAGIGYAALQ